MIRHLAGIAEIVEDVDAAVAFYRDVLSLPVEHKPGEGYAHVQLAGVLHFGIWGQAFAAQSVWDDSGRAGEVPLGFTLGFEVDDVAQAAKTLGDRLTLLQPPKTEPWGQITSRFRLPSGALGEVSQTPWARTIVQQQKAQPG